jgi:hypothetical protein
MYKCHHKMRPGIAMGETVRRHRLRRGKTVFVEGPGYIKPCLKCIKCGYSVEVSNG